MSYGYADHGRVEVSVVGGYSDARGDAAKNSISLLRALHEDPRLLELKHFCVGRFNTKPVEAKNQTVLQTETTAILKGIAVDLKTQQIYPATFEWGNYDDFKLQLKDRFRLRQGQDPIDTEEANKTADSTFKPKSLRNKANHEYLLQVQNSDVNKNQTKAKRKAVLTNTATGFEGLPFKVKLKPTIINDKVGRKPKRKVKKKSEQKQ